MTITSLKSELCCGCAVCYDRCPVNAISMRRTQKAILLLSLMLHYVLIVVSVPKSAHR